jgi:hypothetical protein
LRLVHLGDHASPGDHLPDGGPDRASHLLGPAYRPRSDEGLLIGVDWNGVRRAALRVTALETRPIVPSPDGSRLLIEDQVWTSSGGRLGTVSPGAGKLSPVWAEDSRTLCTIRDPSGVGFGDTPQELDVVTPGSPYRRVAPVGPIGGQQGPQVVGCNLAADVAVVAQAVVDHVGEVRVIRISTGALVGQHVYSMPDSCLPSGPCDASQVVASVTASRDGRFIAEGYRDEHAVIRDAATWRVLGSLPRSVRQFSWDGSRVLAVKANGASILDWRSGRTLVSGLSSNAVLLPHPTDNQLMTGVGLGRTLDLVLLRADGSTMTVAAGVVALPG